MLILLLIDKRPKLSKLIRCGLLHRHTAQSKMAQLHSSLCLLFKVKMFQYTHSPHMPFMYIYINMYT